MNKNKHNHNTILITTERDWLIDWLITFIRPWQNHVAEKNTANRYIKYKLHIKYNMNKYNTDKWNNTKKKYEIE